jgi:hypothetical protein
MSQLLINEYLKQLAVVRRVHVSERETIVFKVCKDLRYCATTVGVQIETVAPTMNRVAR